MRGAPAVCSAVNTGLPRGLKEYSNHYRASAKLAVPRSWSRRV